MSERSVTEILKNILSVIAGVGAGILVFFAIGLFLFFSGIGWRDKEYIRSVDTYWFIGQILMILLSTVIAGVTTARISSRKNFLYPLITGISLLLLLMLLNDFEFDFRNFATGIAYLVVIPLTLGGAFMIMRSLKKINHEN